MTLLWELVAAPLVLSAAVGLGARRCASAMSGRVALRMLAVTAVACAAATGFALTVGTLFVLARSPLVAAVGDWSIPALPRVPLPWQSALGGAGLITGLLGLAARHTARAVRQLRLAHRTSRELDGTSTSAGTGSGRPGWTLLQDDRPDAYAIPGRPGRVVVSTGMLTALTPAEHDVLLAHEQSHLRHHHHLWIQMCWVAAAANPLLRRLPAAAHLAAEREADEDSGRPHPDRALVAGAVAHAALARGRGRTAVPASPLLGAAGSDVVLRVRLLVHPPSRWRARATSALVIATTGAVLAAAGAGAHLTEQRFEQARPQTPQHRPAQHRPAVADPVTAAQPDDPHPSAQQRLSIDSNKLGGPGGQRLSLAVVRRPGPLAGAWPPDAVPSA